MNVFYLGFYVVIEPWRKGVTVEKNREARRDSDKGGNGF